MEQIATFEKVSYNEFKQAMSKDAPKKKNWSSDIEQMYEELHLPERATTGSAGYDFHSPFGFTLRPDDEIKIPTGVRCRIDEGWVLTCFPRSGLGFKYVRLANDVGIVDSDYYNAKNEGHIFIKLRNEGGEVINIKQGDKIAQGIFFPFGITTDDNATGERTGGFGSTGA